VDEGAAGTLGSEMTEDTESETTENTEQDQHGDTGARNLNEDRSRPRFARVMDNEIANINGGRNWERRLCLRSRRPSLTPAEGRHATAQHQNPRECISPCVLSISGPPC
jgi:hypothetical protein